MNNNSDFCPELDHELIIPLQNFDDIYLWKQWQNHQEKARYLVAIFGRYYNVIESLKIDFQDDTVINKYFKQIWIYIIDKLAYYPIYENTVLKDTIINLAKTFFQEQNVIYNPVYVQVIDYNLLKRYVPLIYFLTQGLNRLTPLERLTIVAIDKFGWQEDKIIKYLQQHQQDLTMAELKSYYAKGYSNLINNLPTDIIAIYLALS